MLVFGVLAGCNPPAETNSNSSTSSDSPETTASIDTNLKPEITTLEEGLSGPAATTGDRVYLLCQGTLVDGKKEFFSNHGPEGDPYLVELGVGKSLVGMEKGLEGIKPQEKRRIMIPAALGYGAEGIGDKVPPNADLNFEVETLWVLKKENFEKLVKEDIKIGNGPVVSNGDAVLVHYTGRLINGKKFDSSHDRKEPFQLTVGAPGVIEGWIQGIAGMRVGGVRRLIVPPALGYGVQGSPPAIGPNEMLDFEIELVARQ